MMLEMYVECFTDQLMLHCKNILISNNLVPGVAVRSDPQTRTMILTLYGQENLTVTFGIEQKAKQEIIFKI